MIRDHSPIEFFRPTRAAAAALLCLGLACSEGPDDLDDPGPGSGAGGGSSAGGTSGSGGTNPDPQSPPRSPPPHEDSPEIEVWYGTEQTIGGPGRGAPQRWVNVLGRIHEPTASAASYSVNGGPEVPFPFGPSTTRLLGAGDFNLEIDRASLAVLPEENTVDLFVDRGSGDFLFRRVILRVHPAADVPTDLVVDWTALADISEVTQVAAAVDGLWHLSEQGIRTTEIGYDRLLALGSQDWSGNYEVLGRFIVHSMRNWGGIGLAVGWQGHAGDQDPREDWPLEALGWVRQVVPQPELQLMAFRGGVLARRDFDLELETPYLVRLRTERTSQGPWASLNLWQEGSPEPSGWLLQAQAPENDGGVLLVTHHADVTWGEVRVSPLD